MEEKNQPKVHFSAENVYIYPSSSQGIAGRVFLIERANRQITLAWTPYYMFQQAKSSGEPNPTDLYAIQVPLEEIRCIKKYTPSFKVHHIVVVSESGVAFPPYYFQGGGLKEFMYALKSHVNLVKSEDDPNTFYLTDLDEPMSLLRSSLDSKLMQEANKAEIDEPASTILPSTKPIQPADVNSEAPKAEEPQVQIQPPDQPQIQPQVQAPSQPQAQPPMSPSSVGSPKSPDEKHWGLLQNFSKVTQFARYAVRGDLKRDIGDLKRDIDNQFTTFEKKVIEAQRSPTNRKVPSQSAPEVCAHPTHTTKIGSFELLDDEKIKMNLPKVVRSKEISPDEWMGLFDEEGRINDEVGLAKRVFQGGVDPIIRVEVWKYLLGLYPLRSTYEEREKILKQKRAQYEQYKSMWKGIMNDDIFHWNKFKSRCHNIDKDVVRTDRTMEYYEGDGNPNLTALNDVLSTYIFLNTDLGYVQGMNELLSPILYVMNNEADAFWCFHYLMESPKHGFMCNFDRDQNGMRVQLNQLSKLVSVIDPGLYEYLKEKDCLNMFFCFRWILIHFKREFSFHTIQRLWEVMWTNQLTNFHLFIAAAVLLKHRQHIISRNMAFDDIIKYTNDLAGNLHLEEVLKEAEEVYNLFVRAAPVDVLQELQTLPTKKPAAI